MKVSHEAMGNGQRLWANSRNDDGYNPNCLARKYGTKSIRSQFRPANGWGIISISIRKYNKYEPLT